MGKTFKRNSQFRPKKQGKVFTKDTFWKKGKKKDLTATLDNTMYIDKKSEV